MRILQFFPFWAPDQGGQGSPVITSQNYVNPYTGDANAFDAANTMEPQIKQYYNTDALENARAKHVFAQFGKNVPLPENHGMSLEFRKPNTFKDVPRLTEGVIPDGEKFGYSVVNMAIYEHGQYAALSRRLKLHAIDEVAQDITEEMGAAAGDTLDKLARNTVMGGSAVMYCPNGSTEVTTRGKLEAACVLTPDMVAQARTWLKKRKAPTINGKYVAIIHPSVAYDLRKSNDWMEAHKYAATTEIFNGEIGELHGVRFVEADNAKVLWGKDLASNSRTLKVSANVSAATSVSFTGGTVAADALKGRYVLIGDKKFKVTGNTTSALTLDSAVTANANVVIYPGEGGKEGCAVYATIFLGKDAFAVIDVAGNGLQIIHKTAEQAGGPLNQFETIGVKFETGSGILYEDRILRVESGSYYSSIDEDTDEVDLAA